MGTIIHILFSSLVLHVVYTDQAAALQASSQLQYTCRCSMLEIYNESVYDLLTATGEDLDLQLKPKSEEVHVKGLSWEQVETGSVNIHQVLAANVLLAAF